MTTPVTGIQVTGLDARPISGLRLMIAAFAKNYEVIQKYNVQQMALGANLQKKQADEAAVAIKGMQDGPIKSMNDTLTNGSLDTATKSAYSSKYSSELNILNTKYNQKSAEYNGIISGVNQSSSDTTQTLQTNLQMMGTNGILSIMQTLTQILA